MKPDRKKSVSWNLLKPVPENNQEDFSLLKSLVYNRSTLSWIIAPDDTLAFANPAFFQLFGLTGSSIKQKVQAILPKEIVRAFVENHRAVCNKSLPFVTTKQAIKYNGRTYLYCINVYPVTDNRGITMAAGDAWRAEETQAASANSSIQDPEERIQQEKKQHDQDLARMIIQVQEKERHLVGHELHDNINQLLAVSKMFLETIQITDEDNQMLKNKALDSLVTAMQEIRKLTKQIVTPQLKENGLIGSIRSLVKDMNCSCLFRLLFAYSGNNLEDLADEKKIMLYRILQEQMNNIIKYSHAKNVTINLAMVSGMAELTIVDDGIGFDTNKVRNGIGLSGIFERVESYSGKAYLKSSPGKGCSLVVQIPFDNI